MIGLLIPVAVVAAALLLFRRRRKVKTDTALMLTRDDRTALFGRGPARFRGRGGL